MQAMNICEAAKNAQEKDWRYGKADRWVPGHINEGEKLYQLDLGPRDNPSSNFFINEDTYNLYWDSETNTFDVKRYCNDAQIAPYFDGTYKGHISEFEVGEGGLDVAYGICENNPSFGTGGCLQVYVGDDSIDRIHKSEQQISPEISDMDRTIGKENASIMLSNSIEENLINAGYPILPTEENANTQALTDNAEDIFPAAGETKSQDYNETAENILPVSNETNAKDNAEDNSIGLEP